MSSHKSGKPLPAVQQAQEILKRLKVEFPQGRYALEHKNVMQLLVATILSAQCTDQRVNLVTQTLFKKYKTPKDFANAKQTVFEQEIHSTGFYKNKAKNIIASAKKIVSDYNGKVPNTMDELLTLPGVARKTANIILSVGFNVHVGIAVDTHVLRLSQRLGLSKNKTPEKIEQDLMPLVDSEDYDNLSFSLILHGRETCRAKDPACADCVLKDICPSAFNFPKMGQRITYDPHALIKKEAESKR